MSSVRKVISSAVKYVRAFSSSPGLNSRVAVVLSGCGVYDGSEIHEASACLVHLSRHGADVSMFAPDKPQYHVIDHCKGAPSESETRNVLVESARIARGNISPLSELTESLFDAIVFPGGFGAAKNLSTFAFDAENFTVDSDVERVIRAFLVARKPLGFCCISPVIAAKVIPNVQLTVGMDSDEDGRWPYAGTAAAIEKMGAKHHNRDVNDIFVDEERRVVSTPAFMCNGPLHLIYEGIGNLIATVVWLTENKI